MEQCADDIVAQDPDPEIRRNALRWKIIATDQSERAALQLAPSIALLDTWSLAAGMKAFLSPGGAGEAIFGREQPTAVALAEHWDAAAQALAQQLLEPRDFERYGQFVREYTSEHPYVSLKFVRPSVAQLWLQRTGAGTPLLDSLGTVPQALADTADRMQMMAGSLPSQSVWRTQLALERSGLSGPDLHAALLRLDGRLAGMSAFAASSPELVRQALGDIRHTLLEVVERLDASSAATMQTLHSERSALSATLSSERAAVLSAADVQRKALAADAAAIARQVVSASAIEVRRLTLELGVLAILFAVILLGTAVRGRLLRGACGAAALPQRRQLILRRAAGAQGRRALRPRWASSHHSCSRSPRFPRRSAAAARARRGHNRVACARGRTWDIPRQTGQRHSYASFPGHPHWQH